jgi:predicted transcriptional regulator
MKIIMLLEGPFLKDGKNYYLAKFEDGRKEIVSVTYICELMNIKRNTFYSRIRDEGLKSKRFFRKTEYKREDNFKKRKENVLPADFKLYMKKRELQKQEIKDKMEDKDKEYHKALMKYYEKSVSCCPSTSKESNWLNK